MYENFSTFCRLNLTPFLLSCCLLPTCINSSTRSFTNFTFLSLLFPLSTVLTPICLLLIFLLLSYSLTISLAFSYSFKSTNCNIFPHSSTLSFNKLSFIFFQFANFLHSTSLTTLPLSYSVMTYPLNLSRTAFSTFLFSNTFGISGTCISNGLYTLLCFLTRQLSVSFREYNTRTSSSSLSS